MVNMTTFYVYAEGSTQYLGQLDAADADVAKALAAYLWPQTPFQLETQRLRLSQRLAA
jgi:hypothetical protein